MLRVELIAHMDAGDRKLWRGSQDERPLSDLGRRQAQRLADELCSEPFDAVYSSPALRCRQTVEPVAAKYGLVVSTLTELRESDGFAHPEGWEDSKATSPNVIGGAYAAGRGLAALRMVRAQHAEGRVLVCTHGDVLPALLALLRGLEALDFPPPHERRGGWETLMIDGDHMEIYQHPLIEGFPP